MRRLWCRLVGHRWVAARGSIMVMPTMGLGVLWVPCAEGEAQEGWGCPRCTTYKPRMKPGDLVIYGAGRSE